MARSIAGLFADRASAEQAIVDLKAAGFDPSRIGLVMRDVEQSRQVAEEHGTQSTEGAVSGGIVGGTTGGLLAATGALAIPGVGPFISGGILATALVGGALGWLAGGLVGLGVPKEEGEYYEQRVQQGSALVTVDAQGRDAEAREILLRDGAEDLSDRGFGGGYDAGAAQATTVNTTPDTTSQVTQSTPVQRQTESATYTADDTSGEGVVERGGNAAQLDSGNVTSQSDAERITGTNRDTTLNNQG